MLLLAGAGWALRHGWTTVSDAALLQLRLDRMPGDLPLVGVYSRFGWFHPGPAFFYLLWPWYTLFGSSGLVVGMVVWHVVALAVAWLLARRISETAGGLVLLISLGLLWTRPPDQDLLPWNPFVGIVATVTLLVAAWSATERRRGGSLLLLPLGSLLVQSHVGYLPLVGAVVIAAAVLALLPTRARPIPWLWWVIGVAISIVMWLPAVWDQVAGSGNLMALLRGMLRPDEPALGSSRALEVMASAYGVPPSWLPWSSVDLPTAGATPWLALLPLAAVIVALGVRRGRGTHVRLLLVLGAANAAALIGIAAIRGHAWEYLVAWVPAVVATTVGLSIWVLLDCIPGLATSEGATTEGARRLANMLAVAAVVVAAVVGWNWAHAPLPAAADGAAVRVLGAALAREAIIDPATLTRGPTTDDVSAGIGQGALATARALGSTVGPDPQIATWVGMTPPTAGGTSYSVLPWTPGFVAPAGTEVVAVYDPFTAEQWHTITSLDERIAAPDSDQRTRYLLAVERAQVTDGQGAYVLVRTDPA